MIVKLSSEELPMTFSKKELSEIIQEYMQEKESFSFKSVCSYIFNRAKCDGRIQKEKDTEYQGGIKMSFFDETLISQLLWEEIWDKKLFINFSKNPYFIPTNEIQFVVKRNG